MALMRRTTLYEIHRRLGARMVDFGGWEMPLQYSSILEEHHAVRRSAGLFDVSHMGEIEIRGPEAGRLVNRVTTNDVSRLAAGQAQYSAMLYEHGGFVDDLLVHKAADDSYFLCVNAANQEKDYRHIVEHNRFEAGVENAGPRYAQLAIQGPRALETLQKLTQTPLAQIRYYHFVDGEVSGSWARIARTGYTGEDGFEIYLAPEQGPRAWEAIVEAKATRRYAKAGRLRDDKPRNCAGWPRGLRGRLAGGMGDQRRAVADSEQKHRTVLSSRRQGARRAGDPDFDTRAGGDRGDGSHAVLQTSAIENVPGKLSLYQGTRVGAAGGRHRNHRHHRLRAEATGRHRVRRFAQGGDDRRAGQGDGVGGIGESGERDLLAGFGRSNRGKRAAGVGAGNAQPRSARRSMAC